MDDHEIDELNKPRRPWWDNPDHPMIKHPWRWWGGVVLGTSLGLAYIYLGSLLSS